MTGYVPMPGPLPGEQWIPSNGTEQMIILEGMCTTCARDRAMREGWPIEECDDDELCEIIGAVFSRQAVEWREIDGEVTCLAYVRHGEPIPEPRCQHTGDLFQVADGLSEPSDHPTGDR